MAKFDKGDFVRVYPPIRGKRSAVPAQIRGIPTGRCNLYKIHYLPREVVGFVADSDIVSKVIYNDSPDPKPISS